MTKRAPLLIVTALVEFGTGLALLLLPSIPLNLLLGLHHAAPEALFIARIAGAALLSIGVASYVSRNDNASPAQSGVLFGVLIYDVAAAVLLGYAGAVLTMAGILLWPALVLHMAFTVWCLLCLGDKLRRKGATLSGDSV